MAFKFLNRDVPKLVHNPDGNTLEDCKKAFEQGMALEYWSRKYKKWCNTLNPQFSDKIKYRIKKVDVVEPPPKKYKKIVEVETKGLFGHEVKFIVVLRDDLGSFHPAKIPVNHATSLEALTEAKRLAKEYKREFVVLGALYSAEGIEKEVEDNG